ncbi:hypothetical protein GCM10009665_13100 [Kitasatospora nipponensis]|uniref:Branched-subunit amino acid transport protein AzlD n=1 Tax=Kitasatospora nipponensis TaxID=258049 RepID=A0ABN1VYI8_9ACTN
MVESAKWPVIWTGFLMIAVSVRLAATARMHRHRRLARGRRPSHLEWVPALVGLPAVLGAAPRILCAGHDVLMAADEVGLVLFVAACGLLLYGVVVLARRVPR